MKENAKCFILENGEYKETIYIQIKERRDNEPKFKERKFIELHGMLLEVTEQDYKQFQKEERRKRYLNDMIKSYGSMFTHKFADEYSDYEIDLPDPNSEFEQQLIDKLLLENMLLRLQLLEKDEFELIKALYLDGISERKLSEITGISRGVINRRKNSVIEKLKKLLDK